MEEFELYEEIMEEEILFQNERDKKEDILSWVFDLREYICTKIKRECGMCRTKHL